MFDVSKSAIERIKQISKKKIKSTSEYQLMEGGAKVFHINLILTIKLIKKIKFLTFNDVQILIDPTSLDFLKGSQLDFVNDLIGSYFKVSNPNASSTCGCGTSFSV